MVFPVVGGNESKGYEISNSLRFNDGDSASLARTPSSEGNRDTFTISFCFKRGTIGTRQFLINSWGGSTNDYAQIEITSSDGINVQNTVSNTSQLDLRTNRKFRDSSAWYHIVLAVDSTQSTASNRAKLYVNGVQETSFSTETYMNQNNDTYFNDDTAHYIGKRGDNSNYFDGYLTEFHMVDGSQLAQTSFGEFDDNGVWIPIKYTGTYGTNGFFLQFKQTGTSANASGIGADTSGNTHHWTPDNLAALDVTEDTCTNNFATFNPLYVDLFNQERTLSEGNTEVDFAGNSARGAVSLTQAVNNGKWYFEIKVVDNSGFYPIVGSINENASQTAPYGRRSTGTAIAYDTDGTLKYENSNTSYGSALSNGDIFQIALDMDNHLLWFGINGTWQNSATQTEIENSTATNDATTKVGEQTFLTNFDDITIFMQDVNSSGNAHAQLNTGNPAFSISSGNTDGKYGNFEYAPPSGYYALCTKRLAEFG